MNKILFLLAISILGFVSCSAPNEKGIEINGVRWATRNVDTPGTFTRNPENAGSLFTWYEAQDACPRGWRLPTREELESLRSATDGEWITMGEVNGRTFGTTSHQVFLPAAGMYNADADVLFLAGATGFYWSSLPYNTQYAWTLNFVNTGSNVHFNLREWGFSVRCVSE
jgi:uncharacterized protein (TIGR02145 family)